LKRVDFDSFAQKHPFQATPAKEYKYLDDDIAMMTRRIYNILEIKNGKN
jgi:hypothetical protein